MIVCGLLAVLAGTGVPAAAEPPSVQVGCPGARFTTAAQLDRLGACELERLFAQAEVGEPPVGFARGRVLLLLDARWPRARARLAGLAWKGKHFAPDGSFVNQWPGFRALGARAACGPSWYDGRPCLVMEYPAGTPVFGNARDEVRQVGPGLYLGRLYQRCPCPRFRGYFALELHPCWGSPLLPAEEAGLWHGSPPTETEN
jgi:hypothetical protein